MDLKKEAIKFIVEINYIFKILDLCSRISSGMQMLKK